MTRIAIVTGAGLLLALATLRAHDPITTRITWNAEIHRIVQARCASCHAAGGKAPMPLTTYSEARPWARAIREEVLTRRMPKWHAARGHGAFSNDPSLSPFEIALIAAWVDGGAPEGAPAPEAVVLPAPDRGAPAEGDSGRQVSVGCGTAALPEGLLLALEPLIPRGTSLGIAVRLPGGRTEPLALIRDFDPDFAVTYRLRRALTLPAGARLETTEPGTADCRVVVTVAPPR